MATKALKGVDEEKWAEFKALAAKNDTAMGGLFNEAVELLVKHKSKSQKEKLMEYLETHESKLTDDDVARMKEFRRKFRMRQFK